MSCELELQNTLSTMTFGFSAVYHFWTGLSRTNKRRERLARGKTSRKSRPQLSRRGKGENHQSRQATPRSTRNIRCKHACNIQATPAGTPSAASSNRQHAPAHFPCPPTAEYIQWATCQSPKRQRERRVRFELAAKDWDGMRPEHERLELVVFDFWSKKPTYTVLQMLLDNSREHDLSSLRHLLRGVLYRIKQNPTKGVALLPGGGGKMAKMNAKHLPRMEKLYTVICRVHDESLRRIGLLMSSTATE